MSVARIQHSDVEVLIVGAGPTGLVLAIFLTRLGVHVRIVDKAAEPGTTSRAIAVHARTLEFYRQIGLANEVVRHGLEFSAANLWVAGEQKGHLVFGDIGRGISPFPYILAFPQDEHERLLIAQLAQLGVTVERRTELVMLRNRDGCIHAVLKTPEGEETCVAQFLAGCDGARSAVRHQIGVRFPGGTYEHVFYVADVDARGPVMNGELHVALDDADFLAAFPLTGDGHARLIGTVRDEMAEKADKLTWTDVSSHILERLQVEIDRVNWFSTYHVHHRVANQFRNGRTFLLGDAAHIHSPVGGQGMNTGIGDAVNLAWKLAAVLRGANPLLLGTYQPERMAFANRLVETTDRAFVVATKNGGVARRMRLQVVPRVLPPLVKLQRVRRFMFRTVSQTAIHYHASPLSLGGVGGVRAGDRLPWIPKATKDGRDNHSALSTLDWQVHVFSRANPMLRLTCEERRIPIHTFEWSPAAKAAGMKRDAYYLVRPDGHVAIALPLHVPAPLATYLREWSIRGT